ncbi:MAG: hypothetical protein IPJ88_09345 [Myxococcales bacterium]|nr:MAG: hypothetical protein IPJ88_09345 [Myxococcales bacterium]
MLGAERWLLKHQNRIFLDKRCNQRFPVELPKQPRFHRILTCRGTAQASLDTWGGTGSLFVTNQTLEQCLDRPFQLGSFDSHGNFFHIFDEVALDIVLETVDTISDFCTYLDKKEKFFCAHDKVVATGEEDLLGCYLRNTNDARNGYDFEFEDGKKYDAVYIDETFWSSWKDSEQCAAKQKADEPSYCWDKLIEKFAHHIVNNTQHFSTGGGVEEQEKLLRWMARENRFRRRELSNILLNAVATTPPNSMRKQYVLPWLSGDPYWVFLVLPKPPSVDYDDYRTARRTMLEHMCLVVKHLNPSALDICGIATEPYAEGMSEDTLYFNARSWTKKDQENAQKLYAKFEYFKEGIKKEATRWEFPLDNEPKTTKMNKKLSKQQQKKRKQQLAGRARRKNRS